MTYGIKSTYISRPTPAYFEDTLDDSASWQADVYRLAAKLARESEAKRLIDLGCGRAGKLLPYGAEFSLSGIDYGENFRSVAENNPQHEWIEIDLNTQSIQPQSFTNNVVICADVIEHLPTPEYLLRTLRNAASVAKYVLVSTPDRMRVHKHDHDGPPKNPYHTREWTLAELQGWFEQEGLPVRWAGWTISNDNRPEQRWTSLIVLSQTETIDTLPITFQPAPQYRKSSQKSDSSRLKVWMTPTPSEAGRDTTNAIHQIVCRLDEKLPDYDIELVEQPDNADLRVGHAGQGSDGVIDVAHYHGLYNTAGGHNANHFFAINSHVIRNLRSAKIVTAPSEWIADVLRRDMHLSPEIVGWGVDVDEWTPVTDPGLYVLWNKARTDAVSDPAPSPPASAGRNRPGADTGAHWCRGSRRRERCGPEFS
ncbi:MAG TPA: methyltransferase domain-containing protein, partial [Terriglobales bacterium]|nr:methyltransferase domain-containing protein [Terriglobales bacterium]